MKIRRNLIALFTLIASTALAQEEKPTIEQPTRLAGGINTEVEESIPLLSPDGSTLFFIRTLYEENTGGQYAGQDIWYSKRNTDGSFGEGDNDLRKLNDRANNAVIGFSTSGDKLYMINSATNSDKKSAGIYTSTKDGDDWDRPQLISMPGLEKKEGFVGFYVLPDESAMFISMEGNESAGAEDLYISTKESDNSWSRPIRLSDSINTAGYEQSPYYENGYLYFSSNGHGGIGDADILVSRKLGTGWTEWSSPINLGEPLNSPKFDAALTRGSDGRAYFVSNRDGDLSDIYSVSLQDIDDVLDFIKRQEDAAKEAALAAKRKAEQERMMADQKNLKDKDGVTKVVGPMSAEGMVYFDFDKSVLRPDAKKELDRIAEEIKQNDKLTVTVDGHADNLGPVSYNDQLSKERAEAAKKYLLSKGVPSSKMKTKAYGERKPIADNSTPEGRQDNRRVHVHTNESKSKPSENKPSESKPSESKPSESSKFK